MIGISRSCRSDRFIKTMDDSSLSGSSPARGSENSQEDFLPFLLDDDSSGTEWSPSFSKRSPVKNTHGFSVNKESAREMTFAASPRYGVTAKKLGTADIGLEGDKFADNKLLVPQKLRDQRVVESRQGTESSLCCHVLLSTCFKSVFFRSKLPCCHICDMSKLLWLCSWGFTRLD